MVPFVAMWKGVAVFALTYVLIASRRMRFLPMDRPAGALIGAVLAVAVGALRPQEAAAAIDIGTLALLFAVMGMGAFLSHEGFFEYLAPLLAARVRTRGALLAVVVWGSGLLAAVVTNDAVCVLGAPVVVGWIRRWRLPRLPFLLALATAANTGSVATLVGNPQNMLCGTLGGLEFRTYSSHMAGVALLGLALNHGLLWLLFRDELGGPLPTEPEVQTRLNGRILLTLGIIAGTVIVYMAGANLTATALGGFVVLLVVLRPPPERLWERIDWSILLFFGALFVAVEAFTRSGAPRAVFTAYPLDGGDKGLAAYLRMALVFLVGSNVVSNVPFILVVRDEMARLSDATLGWELLAMASTFAGNLTLLGSVANIIVAEKAREEGGLGFGEHLRVGFPLALLTTVLGTIVLWASQP